MGRTAIFGEKDSGNAGLLLAQNATLAQPGTIQSLSFYVGTSRGNLILGLYDASGPGGDPGNLIVQSAPFATKAGWNTATVPAVALPAGNYWLAYSPSSSILAFRVERSNGRCPYANRAFGTLPAVFPKIVSNDMCNWSFYATLSVP